jgi:hypothetical protein
MQALLLNASSKSLLTATILVADPNNPGKEIFQGFPCGLDGKALPFGVPGIPVYRDVYTGKVYALIAELIPSATDAASKEAAKVITDQNPIHYVSDDGSVKGWFIPAPDYDLSAKAAPAA